MKLDCSFLALSCLVLAAVGCQSGSGRSSGTEEPAVGGMAFQIDFNSLAVEPATAVSTITAVTAIVSRDGYATIQRDLTIVDNVASGRIDGLAPGYWHVEVDVYDNATRTYTGATDVNVIAGAIVQCSILLDPEPAPPPAIPISRTEGSVIGGATEWTWIPFPDAFCTDAVLVSGAYRFGSSTTGLAINWGPTTSNDLVIFLQGGGACWDFFSCGGAPSIVDKTASTGPFGPAQFASDIYAKYPQSWIKRANLPNALRDATIVYIPYCTGDVHSGDTVTTYPAQLPGLQPITWHHVGHANIMAFLKRLWPTFPNPSKLIVSGSSAGGFGSLSNYRTFRSYWPNAKGYLVDDSGPPLIGDAVPSATRSAWYANWNMGALLDPFCPECAMDLSAGLQNLTRLYPRDRIALLSHLTDATIRGFFGTFTLSPPGFTPMSATEFETQLRLLGTKVMDPATENAKYFFTTGDSHPMLEDPTVVLTPAPGLTVWIELMLSDSAIWTSKADPSL